jgi:hypothetical protein
MAQPDSIINKHKDKPDKKCFIFMVTAPYCRIILYTASLWSNPDSIRLSFLTLINYYTVFRPLRTVKIFEHTVFQEMSHEDANLW